MIEPGFMGLNGFVWFMGVVENRNDPLNLGRVQVRIFGWHTENKTEIPTVDLPWAHPILPTNGSHLASTLKEGQYVVGFFSDGESAQFPIIMGSFPGIPDKVPQSSTGFVDSRTNEQLRNSPRGLDSINYKSDGSGVTLNEQTSAQRNPFRLNEPTTSRLYRHEKIEDTNVEQRRKTLDKQVPTAGPEGLYWDEPYPAYNTTPPFNNVIETESGHVFEMDDTPGSERIHMMHRSGSFFEMYPSGTKVEKVTKNNYQIIMGDDMIHVMGHVNITVDSDVNILARGDVNIIGGNDVSARIAGNVDITSGGAFNIKAASFNVDCSGKIDMLGSRFAVDAGRVDLNSGVARAAGIPEAPFRSQNNKPTFEEEPIPVPNVNVVPLENITPEQGDVLTYNQYSEISNTESIMGQTTEEVERATKLASQQELKEISANAEPIVANADAACIPISDLKPSKACSDFIKGFEKFSAMAYKDVYTISIGYGVTAGELGRPLKLGDTITREQAEDDFVRVLNKFADNVKKKITTQCVTQGQFDAMVSLAYNIGMGNFGSSTVLRLTNTGDKYGAADAFLMWNKAGGVVLGGLSDRRKSERKLYLS